MERFLPNQATSFLIQQYHRNGVSETQCESYRIVSFSHDIDTIFLDIPNKGFNADCKGFCPCETYNCRSTEWADKCGFSEGFCTMMEKETPEFKINWIRVYQDPNDETQKVGCSTPERPTKRFIEGNADQYKLPKDVS